MKEAIAKKSNILILLYMQPLFVNFKEFLLVQLVTLKILKNYNIRLQNIESKS